ncbi:WLM-domain-containing protein [Russula earlei]|uniref:WLM-domain-containing protein n=1 Tax=Russula earlei TaxID=71964 RepID=A0ACC0TW29_9AGAM|nr:WLM-domain-containing protein [Russula earlei]
MSTDVWVLSYEHLKGRPRSNEALTLLQKVASLVKPIMRKHGWILPVLAEFFPDDPSLLGLNTNTGGEIKILLRLRPDWAPDTFLPEENIIRTMLHELTHYVYGPHDQNFYNLLSLIEEEYYELKRTGYAGEGFFSNGRRLGAGIPNTPPAWIAKQRALEAAERRRRNNTILETGPVRLGGGDLANLGLTPRELAGLAADMRAADEKRCASGSVASQEAEKAARDSHHSNASDLTPLEYFDFGDGDLIVLDESEEFSGTTPPRASRPAGQPQPPSPRNQGQGPSGSRLGVTPRPPPAVNVLTKPRPPHVNNASKPLGGSPWTCPTCTLVNQPAALRCDACLGERPWPVPAQTVTPAATDPAGWTCDVCGERGMEHTFWTCRFCGSVKGESIFFS